MRLIVFTLTTMNERLYDSPMTNAGPTDAELIAAIARSVELGEMFVVDADFLATLADVVEID